jgi:formate-dependent nitrite reductase membrane component NrfD
MSGARPETLALAVHFSQPPEWRWYILGYFFLAGLAGGAYLLGTMLRLLGRPADESAARLCFLITLPLLVLCPILLTIDLGQPARFWHMLWDTGAGGPGLNVKGLSPMSMGVWGLLVFSVFAVVSFLEVVARDGRYQYPLSGAVATFLGGPVGRAVNVVGSLLALFVGAYTGVLLSVSNQPVWSDTYALGGLFLASGISGAAALVTLATRWRPSAAESHDALAEADGYFALLELAFIAVTLVSLALAGQLAQALGPPWFLLWIVAILALLPPIAGRFTGGLTVSGSGIAALARVGISATATSVIVLVGVLALRAAVLWSAQG